jgi:hypothetical protein
MACHRDYYEDALEAETHNTAPAFPQILTGDSWVGALCAQHQPRASSVFRGAVGVLCTNPACPAACSICALEFVRRPAPGARGAARRAAGG